MKTAGAFEVDSVVDADGAIRVEHVPFAPGELVHVLIQRKATGRRHSADEIEESRRIREAMADKPLFYDRPDKP